MIYIYTGSLGSGKSYHAMVEGLNRANAIFRPNALVVANFPIFAANNKEKERWVYVEKLTVKQLIELSFKHGIYGRKDAPGLLIIDEAPLYFNARDWNVNDGRREWLRFFSLSRRFGFDVILIAQDLRMIDRQIRSMIEYEIKHVMANRYGWLKFLPLKTFFYIWFWTGGKFKGGLQIGFLLPWVAKKYDTMRQFTPSPELIALAKEHGYDILSSSYLTNAHEARRRVRVPSARHGRHAKK